MKEAGRSIFFTLFLALLVICFTPAFAASDGDEDIFTQDYMRLSGLADQGAVASQVVDWDGDTCYAYLSDMSVCTYRTGVGLEKLCTLPPAPEALYLTYESLSAEALDMLKNTVTYVAAYDGALYGYNVFSGKFGRIDAQGIHWGDVLLDMDCLNPLGNFFPDRVARSFVTDRHLYTFVSLAEMDADRYAFYGFDLATGDSISYSIENSVGVCRESGETFLFLCRLEDTYALRRLDTLLGEITDLEIPMKGFPSSATVGGLAYDAQKDAICVTLNGQVFRSEGGEAFFSIAYMPADALMAETPGWILPDGRYALWLNGVHIRTLREEMDEVQLVYQAGTLSMALDKNFKEKYPDIRLTHVAALTTAEELAEKLVTQDSSVDIFELCVDYAYTALVRKGQTVDLSASKWIANDVASMDETIQAVLTDSQGNVVAYPSQMYVAQYGINEGLWNLAFAGRPFPSDLDGILDAWLEWELDWADAYPGVEFVYDFDYAYWCEKLLTAYVQQHDIPGELPDLFDKSLRGVLEKLQRIKEIREAAGRCTTEPPMDAQEKPTAIFIMTRREAMKAPPSVAVSLSADYIYGVKKGAFTWIPMAFAAGDEPKMDATLYVYVVNPNSKHIAEAIQFIECAAHIESNPYMYYAAHPQLQSPYESPNFERSIASHITKKAELEQALQFAGEDDRADIEYMLMYVNEWLERQEELRWMITAETIAQYWGGNKLLDLHADSLYIGDDGSAAQAVVYSACARYASGNLSLDDFLNELTQKMQMMYLETM